VSFRCFVDNFDVLSTKEQQVDERLGEAFLGCPQTFCNINISMSDISKRDLANHDLANKTVFKVKAVTRICFK
jgi:hypothetical protein